jgi:replicative DNA helicase
MKNSIGLDMVIIDYLQLMSSIPADNSEREMAHISHSLKALAKELDIPVLALSEVKRSVEQRQDKRPLLSDLRDSGTLEEDADLIIFLYRDEVYTCEKCIKPGLMEIIVAKHRNGPLADFDMAFIKDYMQLREMGDGWHNGNR